MGIRANIGSVTVDLNREGLSLPKDLNTKIHNFLEHNRVAKWAIGVSKQNLAVRECEDNKYDLLVDLNKKDYVYWRLANG